MDDLHTYLSRSTRRNRRARRSAALVVVLATMATAVPASGGATPSGASGVSGEAYGHYTNVGLFGGAATAVGPDPHVILPATGSSEPLTASDPDGAAAVYGPATVFGGRWPEDVATAPPSGPIAVSTRGSPGPDGSVTSTATIGLHPQPVPARCYNDPVGSANCTAPGGFGPAVPVEGDELHATCTADADGVRGSTRLVNTVLSLSTDMQGEPREQEPLPEEPPANYTRETTIDNVGGNPLLIFNEQIIEPDGSITVNAIHMFLRGPIALGERILGHVRCSMLPAPAAASGPATSTTANAVATQTPPSPSAAASPTVADRGGSGDGVPAAGLAAAGAGIGALVLLLFWARRRSHAEPDEAGAAPP